MKDKLRNATWAFYDSFVASLNKDKDMNDKSKAGPYIVDTQDEVEEAIYAPTEGN